MIIRTALAAITAASFMLAGGQAFAQDASEAGRTLPDICTSGSMDMGASTKSDSGGMAMQGDAAMSGSAMDEGHTAMMADMEQMNANMMQGMAAKDVDVAFVCGMIPHHQGAIDMAKAELQYGDDPWAKEMAQKVIDAQEQEIADMLDWLKKQSK